MELILDFAFITAFLFNILILFLLAKNSSKEFHKRILQIIFLFIALSLCQDYAYLHKIRWLFYGTFIFDHSIATVIGPLLLLYVKSIFLPQKSILKENKIHFIIPVIFLFVFTVPALIYMYSKGSVSIFNYIKTYEVYIPLIVIYSLIYCVVALQFLGKGEKVIKHNYSNLDGVDLSWIRLFLIGAILVISIDILSTVYELLFGELEWNTLYITSVGVVFLVIYMAYHGVLQSKVLISPFLLQKENFIVEPKNDKNVFSLKYSESELMVLEKKLNAIMEQEKPFLDENLSLKSLAELLDVSDKKLSAILNQHLQVSFYDYVNGFKVANVIKKMKDSSYDNYTLLAIAFESGFNSKTSFNRIFKKVTNISPSQYKKQLQ